MNFLIALLHPRDAVVRRVFQVFLVQLAASVELAQLQFHVDVLAEQLLLGAFPDGGAQDFAGLANVQLAQLKLGEHQPNEGEGELLVGHNVQTRLPHLPALVHVLHVQLLIDRVVRPQPNVTTPKAFFLQFFGRNVRRN